MTREHVAALRMPLIACTLTLLVTACTVLYSGSMLTDARQLLARAEAHLRSERLRMHNAAEEEATVARYAGAYQQLARSGIAGEEQRINWLDGLRLANRDVHTFGVEYDVGAQRPYAYASEVNPGPLRISESPMQIRLLLLHEEDLPRFIDALARSGSGFFTVDRCIVRRLTPSDGERPTQGRANLLAECELRWLTIRAASEKK